MRISAERYGIDSPQVLRISLRLDRLLNEEAQLPAPPRTKEGTCAALRLRCL